MNRLVLKPSDFCRSPVHYVHSFLTFRFTTLRSNPLNPLYKFSINLSSYKWSKSINLKQFLINYQK
nr:MAG TPA: hypothetical protein [Caudoviricetes sp.]